MLAICISIYLFCVDTVCPVFTARRYASAVYAIVMCLFVSHTPIFYQNG